MKETKASIRREMYEQIERLQKAELPELLTLIDALYGRNNLRYGATVEDVRAEAIRQLRKDYDSTIEMIFPASEAGD